MSLLINMLKRIFKSSLALLFILPLLTATQVLAASPPIKATVVPVIKKTPSLSTVITNVNNTILGPLVGVLLTAALVVFFWGMVKYISGLGSEQDKKAGKEIMVWGIVALFVMISVWGLVRLLQGNFLGGADTGAFDTIQMPGG